MQSYRTIVIVGGGCYGSYYVKQLHRARNAKAVEWDRLVVVDRDAECKVALSPEMECDLVVDDWGRFFYSYLNSYAQELSDEVISADSHNDAIVPSPLMPHLMYEWLVTRAKERWPDKSVNTIPLEQPLDTPWQRSTEDGTHYASFATWMCPINCIEPRTCLHTKGPRDWDMINPPQAHVAKYSDILGPFIFQCTHRAYGVGMFDTADVIRADTIIAREAAYKPAKVLVGTVSRCHGAFNMLGIKSNTTPR